MTSLASRALVALGYHTSATVTQYDGSDQSEVRRCIYWCYYMDKTLSMLLARPSSLPVLPFHPIDLVETEPENPLSYKVRILVKLAQVQDTSLFLMLRDRKQKLTDAEESALVENLHVELKSINEEIRQVILFRLIAFLAPPNLTPSVSSGICCSSHLEDRVGCGRLHIFLYRNWCPSLQFITITQLQKT